jgi:histone H3/H4
MARMKTFVGTRKPDAAGSVKTPRKATGPGLAPKGILKKTAQPAAASTKKPKKSTVVEEPAAKKKKKKQQQQRVVEEEEDNDDDEEVPATDDEKDEPQAVAAAEVAPKHDNDDDDEAVSTDDDEEEAAGGARAAARPRRINHALRRLKRMKTLQKSDARLCTEAGFKRLVRYVLWNSSTAAMGLDRARFTRAALQNLQAAVESQVQLILSDTAQQVYTITGRNARVSAAPIATTAEQRLRGMNGAQFINDYREVCSM